MKVGKAYLGKMVTLKWNDPSFIRTRAPELPLVGKAALAVQEERGVIDDLTDGIVRVVHTLTVPPGGGEASGTNHSWVPEELITEIVIYIRQPEGVPGGEPHV